MKKLLPSLLCFASLLLGLPPAALAAPATAFIVDSAADHPDANLGDGDCADSGGHCTLRAAVMQANAHPGPDTILLPGFPVSLTVAGANDEAALTGDLDLTGTVTLQGVSAQTSIIDATGLGDRVIDVLPNAHASLLDLTVRGGRIPTTSLTIGGGILNSGALTLTRVTLARNGLGDENGTQYGGALANPGLGWALLDHTTVISNEAFIGAILNDGRMTLRSSTVVTNISTYGAGIFSDGDLTVTASAIISNFASIDGGGLYSNFGNLILNNSLVAGNRAQQGAGFWQHGGSAHLNGVLLRGNHATGGAGGGLLVEDGTVDLAASTLTGNTAGEGGGVAVLSTGAVAASNTTIESNLATGNGGGLYQNGGQFDGYNVSMAFNVANSDDQAGGRGGGLFGESTFTLTLTDSIVAGNIHVASQFAIDDDCFGHFGTFRYSLVADATNCIFNPSHMLAPDDPLLLPLANNGGPTPTLALNPASPALDAGDPTGCAGPTGLLLTDQRGLPRHADGNADHFTFCDLGAYEVQLQVFLPLLRR